VSSLEVAVSALKDAVEIAKSWKARYLTLSKAAKRALRYLERGDAAAAREILRDALERGERECGAGRASIMQG